MNSPRKFDLPSCRDVFEEASFMQYDAWIRISLMKRASYHSMRLWSLGVEMSDLSQDAHIRLWRAFKKKNVVNPKALINTITRSVIADAARRYKQTHWLSTDANDELYHGHLLMTPGEGMQDPAYEFELREIDVGWAKNIIHAIRQLPPRQRYAILCAMNDQFEHIDPLFVAMFKVAGLDIKAAHWPDDAAELRSLKTSLVIARKKLHVSLNQLQDEHAL